MWRGGPSITVQSGGEVPPSLCRVEVRSLHHSAEWRGGPSITVQSGGEVPPSLCRVEGRSLHHCAEWRGGPSITVQSGGEVPPSLCRVEVRLITVQSGGEVPPPLCLSFHGAVSPYLLFHAFSIILFSCSVVQLFTVPPLMSSHVCTWPQAGSPCHGQTRWCSCDA